MIQIIECKFCKKIFDVDGKKKFCSLKCGDNFRKRKSRIRNYKHSLNKDKTNEIGIREARHTNGIIIDESNIDLYCKLSEIIRNKKCKPNIVFAQQKRKFNKLSAP